VSPAASRNGVVSPHPLEEFLPSIYRRQTAPGTEFLPALLEAWDEWLAPVFSTLDNLDAYFDPRLAPADFIDWLGGWVGLRPTQRWPLDHRRARIANAVWLFLWWGTKEGIAHYVSTFTGVPVERVQVIDSGGVDVSLEPNSEISWTAEPRVVVRVAAEGSTIDSQRLDDLVSAAKPAHVLHDVEVR
jgi:phage tail-like protein